MKMIVYKSTNTINNKCYIGQTVKKLEDRKQLHLYRLNSMKNKNWHFYNALRKYGWDNFEWEVLEECDSKEELDEMEFHYIKQYNSYENGYNMTLGGDKGTWGLKHTEETKKKIGSRKYPTGKNTSMYGRHHTEEQKRKWSKMRKGIRPKTKLNENDIYNILKLYFIEKPYIEGVGVVRKNGVKMSYKRALALKIHKKYNVTIKCIEKIIDGENWKDVYRKFQV